MSMRKRVNVQTGVSDRHSVMSMWVPMSLMVLMLCLLATQPSNANQLDEDGYRIPSPSESEFDNVRSSSAPPPLPRVANSDQEYIDTTFGEFLYSEASLATKLEMLRLLSKETPPTQVFLHAISMGLGVDEMLRASASYEGGRARELAVAAVNVLPLVDQTPAYRYSGYELEDIERDEEPIYLAGDVLTRFFDDRKVLRPQPDWLEGQIHFRASAAELNALVAGGDNVRWYLNPQDSRKLIDRSKRPIFVSLYEEDGSVRIDSQDRIRQALRTDPNSKLPVVFIFNRLNEIALDQLIEAEYPLTVRGVRDAYVEKTLMLTPVPEWDVGEHHIKAELSELDELFNLPTQNDFEPEHWQRLLAAARDYSVEGTAFLIVVMPNASGDEADDDERNNRYSLRSVFDLDISLKTQLAAWDNPRSESAFPFVAPGTDAYYERDERDERRDRSNAQGDDGLLGDGLILNRPDLIAALLHLQNELGKTRVPVAFYYVDSARVKSFLRGPRALLGFVEGVPGTPPGGGNGGFGPPPEDPPSCASPPCLEQ